MDNKKTDAYYAEKAIVNIQTIEKYINGKSYQDFLSDEELIDAIMFRLVQLIENVKNISLICSMFNTPCSSVTSHLAVKISTKF